ncbi:hypothetical protein [Desulfonatronum parangueonense]
MGIPQERIDELIKEGFASGDDEVKEINYENGKQAGIIKVLQKMLVESIENIYGEIDSLASKKIRFIQDRYYLRTLISYAHQKEELHFLYKSINTTLRDEDFYKLIGYQKSINNAKSYYENGEYSGYHTEKLSMVYDIFEQRFGKLELEIEAIIKTRTFDDKIDDLYKITFEINDKQDLIKYLNSTMSLHNRIAAAGFVIARKSILLKKLVKDSFSLTDNLIKDKIDKIKFIKSIDYLIDVVNKSNNVIDFTENLDRIVEQDLNQERTFENIDVVHLEDLLQE